MVCFGLSCKVGLDNAGSFPEIHNINKERKKVAKKERKDCCYTLIC